MIQLFCKSLYPHFPSGYDNAASPAPLRAGIIFVPICEYKWKGATTRNNSKATFFILLFVKAIFCWAISEVYYILTLSHWRRSILLVQTVCETQKTHPQPKGCVKMCDLSQLIKKSASFSGEDGIRTRGASCPARQFSKLLVSATHPPLRASAFFRKNRTQK